MKPTFINSRKPVTIKTKAARDRLGEKQLATDRQERLRGFEQSTMDGAELLLIGAGGINSWIGLGLARKGAGRIKILDHDYYSYTNLHRQLCYERDLGKNKAVALARNLARETNRPAVISGYPYSFNGAVERGVDLSCSVFVCGIDNNPGRIETARYFYQKGIPGVFCAVSDDCNTCYCFVQIPGEACWGCAFPAYIDDAVTPCPGTPAIKDILDIVSGFALFSIDTILMPGRKRAWNMRQLFLSGFCPDIAKMVERRPGCPICSGL